jgi:hypothetical protein
MTRVNIVERNAGMRSVDIEFDFVFRVLNQSFQDLKHAPTSSKRQTELSRALLDAKLLYKSILNRYSEESKDVTQGLLRKVEEINRFISQKGLPDNVLTKRIRQHAMEILNVGGAPALT